MYESPIDIYVTQLNMRRREFAEKQVLEAVQGVDININREELEKALRYDRDQYKKGYADGVKEFAERFKEEADATEIRTFGGESYTFYTIRDDKLDDIVKELAGDSDV